MFDEVKYKSFFRCITDLEPFDHQISVARLLFDHKNVLLRAPTGAGKTLAVIVPFLSDLWQHKPSRLIYALPLRTLAQGVYQDAQCAVKSTEAVLHVSGHIKSRPLVTLQTGEQPDDPFFSRGRIIVTTYDQVLSGLLENPYGLSKGLHNINAAAVAGALVVFDEFHLMPTEKAFLTAVAGMRLFADLCQSVWMTATATAALQNLLQQALGAEQVPNDSAEWESLMQSLPSVTDVRRNIQMETKVLTADMVLNQHQNRSIVLFNQVRRAQNFFTKLCDQLEAHDRKIEVILLHSRFFRHDRHRKEERLRELFGKAARSNAILVATQVVEAGVDISCESLHTELCPINSLVQRAGRCARFVGERGTVHVYPLPEEAPAWWLPYGDEKQPDETLKATQILLAGVGRVVLNPSIIDEWVQKVHHAEDERALRPGWSSRLNECLRCIESVVVHRQECGITHFIRSDNEDQTRLIISSEAKLPATPGKREGLSVRRKSLFKLLGGSLQPAGWFWDFSGSEPAWKPLKNTTDIIRTYVVCLKPEIVAYNNNIGLVLGEAGNEESPLRREPPHPGVPALQREPWTNHAQRVAQEAQRRLEEEDFIDEGLLGWGFEHRYGLNTEAINRAARACALLHDLGKLQTGWQTWAEAYQRAREPGYKHMVPLAHTDFDSNNQHDWEIQRGLGLRRPPHSAASAYFGVLLVDRMFSSPLCSDSREALVSACVAAILAHHGGWLPPAQKTGQKLGLLPLCSGSHEVLFKVLGSGIEFKIISKLESQADKRGFVQKWLDVSTHADSLGTWWPVVSFLTRTLRLSDQRATSEIAIDE